ncbi:hypothetical protein Btru_059484 [Bulinus truncatus]|nr:hypothetical protein Btru_059484 [Bulinus truncatus]
MMDTKQERHGADQKRSKKEVDKRSLAEASVGQGRIDGTTVDKRTLAEIELDNLYFKIIKLQPVDQTTERFTGSRTKRHTASLCKKFTLISPISSTRSLPVISTVQVISRNVSST